MNGIEALGRWIIIAGVTLAVVGALIWLVGRLFPGLNGLPGTIRVQTGGLTCIFPLLASIVLSIVLTIILNVIGRLGNR
jgi:hypothetical protein